MTEGLPIQNPKGVWLASYYEENTTDISSSPRLLATLKPFHQTPDRTPNPTTPLGYTPRIFRNIEAVVATQNWTPTASQKLTLRLWAILGEHPKIENDYNNFRLEKTLLIGSTDIQLITLSIPTLPNIEQPPYGAIGYGDMKLYTATPRSDAYGIFIFGQMLNLQSTSSPNRIRIEISGF